MSNIKSLKPSPLLEKEQQSFLEDTPSRSKAITKDTKYNCPSCSQQSTLFCYACCLQIACEHCYQAAHFATCPRSYNKHTLPLTAPLPNEQNKFKKNGKRNKPQQKCKRCDTLTEYTEHCQQCKTNLCPACSQQIHAKGKFTHHSRSLNSSPQKKKRIETIITENGQEISEVSRKQNQQNNEYGFKPKERHSIKPANNAASNKKGRSIAKVPFQNQQNTPRKVDRRKSINQSFEMKSKVEDPSKHKYNEWEICIKHNKGRNILTQNYDMLCSECYEDIKGIVSKIKVLDQGWWIKTKEEQQTIDTHISGILEDIHLKTHQLKTDFEKYRKQLSSEFSRKQELLEERYKTNLVGLQKWQKQYTTTLSQLQKKCESYSHLKDQVKNASIITNNSPQIIKQIENIIQQQSYLLYEQILREKKQYNQQLEQYHFKIATINNEEFEDTIKTFYFARRKVDGQGINGNPVKSLTKISQSNQLRQSRISNSSLTTDRKVVNRDQSSIKANYYQLSNGSNLMKRSMSKQIKQDLTKDISQKILFPASTTKSDRKQKNQKIQEVNKNHLRTSNYFFQNFAEDKKNMPSRGLKKESESIHFGIKDVKYINLETIITEKLDRGFDNERIDTIHTSTPALCQDLKSSIYLGQLTEEAPRNSQSQLNRPASDKKMTCSIIVTQQPPNKTLQPMHSIASSVNSSFHNAKNKRKSDYMEMRDRLRKPNNLNKIAK